MAEMICPYCNKIIGNDKNPFQFEVVSFSYEERVKGRKKPVQRNPSVCAIYCDNCNKVIGITT